MDPTYVLQIVEDVLKGDSVNYETEELISVLKTLDDYYFNDNELIPDVKYDVVRNIVKQLSPSHVYFTGVGSAVRGGKVELPYPMPSLDQIEIGDIKRWIGSVGVTFEDVIITDKMDGASLMLVYDKDGNLQIAYSRGDGIQGADVTRHVRKMKNVPKKISGPLVARLEVELSETSFEYLNTRVKARNGLPYRNARNMVSGVMNAEDNTSIIYEHLDVFGYSILNSSLDSKYDDLMYLQSQGFRIPFFVKMKGLEISDETLADYLNERRQNLDYAIDGLVIDVNRRDLRLSLDKDVDGGNPKSSIKYKVADATNQHVATVSHVEWNISKHGYLKPTVCFEPFELCGVTIKNASGFNAKFIQENGIGKGAKLQMTRSGDVIPFIQHTVVPAVPDMPTMACEWNATGVDLVITNKQDNDEVKIQQLLDFCATLKFPHLKEGNIRKLYEDGVTTCEQMVNVSMVTMTLSLGANGLKAYHGIRETLTGITLSEVMGAFPLFGRGIGQRKMKKLVEALGENYLDWSIDSIQQVEGFDVKTAQLVLEGIEPFDVFYNNTKDAIQYKGRETSVGGKLHGHKVVMTGFRDAALEKTVEALGGENQSAVSAKTTIVVASDPNSTSGKASKARDLNAAGKANIQIMSVKQFKEFIA